MQFSKLFGVTLLAMASSAQAQVFDNVQYAGYIPRTDQNAYWIKDIIQSNFESIMASESCPAVNDGKIEWDDPTTISTYLKSIPTPSTNESKEWAEYTKYYGSNTFHIDWVNAAFNCASTAGFTRDVADGGVHLFDPDFNTAYCQGNGGFFPQPTFPLNPNPLQVVAGKECVGIEESVKKATSYVFQFIEIVQLLENAIRLVRQSGCNMQKDINNNNPVCTNAMSKWDAAAAIFTGSLEGEEGGLPGLANDPNPDNRAYGKTLYTLGEKRCRNFKTCGPEESDLGEVKSPPATVGVPARYETASINSKILQFFASGSHATYSGDHRRMAYFKRKISAKIMVPWTQGVLRYAHRLSSSRSTNASETHKEIAEASTFGLGALPKLWACSKNAAAVVEPFLKTGRVFGVGNEIDFLRVKLAFECNYRCLGITCKEVGELFDGDVNVKPNAEACDDSKNLSGDEDVAKCSKPNSKFIQKCRDFGGRSGIKKRTNPEYFVINLDK